MISEMNVAVCRVINFLMFHPPDWVFRVGMALGTLYAVFSTCWVLARFLLPRARRVVRGQVLLVRGIAYMAVSLWALLFMLLAMVVFSGVGGYTLQVLVTAWFPCLVMLTMLLITRRVVRRTN
jgi:hypothetical protein